MGNSVVNAHIYIVTNTLNDKQYVGQTTVDSNKYGHGLALQIAYDKHGKNNFTYERICSGINNRNTLNYMERFWIKVFNTISPNGYNIEEGGSDKGNVSESTRQKLRDYNLGKVIPLEVRRKISNSLKGEKNPFYGKSHTPEAVAKIIAANVGKTFIHKESTKVKIGLANAGKRNGMYGKKHTEETKAKFKDRPVSRYWLGKKISDQQKSHLSIEKSCPHCNKIGKGNAMIRYHMDNCKFKGVDNVVN